MIGRILLTILLVVLYVLLGLLALALVLLLIPLEARLTYDGSELELSIRYGPVQRKILPKKQPAAEDEEEGGPSNKQERATKQGPEEEETKKKKTKISSEQIFYTLEELPPILGMALKGLGRGIRLKPLKVHILVAGTDPADTALLYGRLYAALATGVPAAERLMRVQGQDVRLFVDFQGEVCDCIADVGISLLPLTAVAVLLRAGAGALRWYLGFRKLASPDEAGSGEEKHRKKTDDADKKEAA